MANNNINMVVKAILDSQQSLKNEILEIQKHFASNPLRVRVEVDNQNLNQNLGQINNTVNQLQRNLGNLGNNANNSGIRTIREVFRGTSDDIGNLTQRTTEYRNSLGNLVRETARLRDGAVIGEPRADVNYQRQATQALREQQTVYNKLKDLTKEEYDLKRRMSGAEQSVKRELQERLKINRQLSLETLRSIRTDGLKNEQLQNQYMRERLRLSSELNISQQQYNTREMEQRSRIDASLNRQRVSATDREYNLGTVVTGAPVNIQSSQAQLQRYLSTANQGATEITRFNNVIRQNGESIRQVEYRVRDSNERWHQYRMTINGTQNSIHNLDRGFRDVINRQLSFTEQMSVAIKKIFEWGVATGIVYGSLSKLREGITYIVQMDTAMTELSKVVDFNTQQMDRMRDSAISLGKELGKSSVDIMKSMAEFGRIYKNEADIEEMAKISVLASNVTTLTAAEAAKALSTTMIAFKKDTKDAMTILNQWNEIKFVSPYTVMYM